MTEIIAGVLILIGAFFSLVAGIGLFRLPDVYLRMHAATKAGTLGGGLILLAVAFHSEQIEVIARALAGIVFLLITAPIGAHLLGRAGYIAGVPLWSKSGEDALAGKYDTQSEFLEGHPPKS
ncbi:MAG: monovalent cation/H(+) antiporter subunit G [Alphaproteobacteria bacterium]|nr:monovalent cation/H(+) antiporter subunit G [Alphaproteobacteria bacterium]